VLITSKRYHHYEDVYFFFIIDLRICTLAGIGLSLYTVSEKKQIFFVTSAIKLERFRWNLEHSRKIV